jgi:hypothetical protein
MITVEGVDQLERLARNLREAAADHDLEKELSKALSAVTRPSGTLGSLPVTGCRGAVA